MMPRGYSPRSLGTCFNAVAWKTRAICTKRSSVGTWMMPRCISATRKCFGRREVPFEESTGEGGGFANSLTHSFTHLLIHSLTPSPGPLRTEKPNAFSSFLRAAKLDDSLDEAFQYLGMFYQEVEGDEVRALKCYQKSFALNPSNLEVAQRLSQLYLDRGDEDSAYSVYQIATEKNLRSHWAWMNLGFAQKVCDSGRACSYHDDDDDVDIDDEGL